MKNEAKEVAIDFLTAVKTGDNAKLAELLHPAIRWNQPGNNSVSGLKSSNMEVFGMVGKMFELSANSLRLSEIKSVSVNGSKVACLLSWTATKPSGESLEVDNTDVYTVENGQIIAAEIFSADIDAENLFWN
ncbi:hypothetical protein SAMN05216490_2561 [Mucilaginibacter mallensis]|uniref:SnoaL-like domain-containing protein n=1 Tax=Mucilaginibacter mallensis TaxID=652787 RepID=A0A1H1XX59_MUCMA|nr:nuclear transport factor 2 family protein [Mucilaginibacter mallensis]SDT13336.1 hypothetical protein SAMN05216490_2561 [Mucilaginibacter mallensis]